jgi:2C-methyl-D-erythritol 2,4-cyclodiphosphate synthase
MVTVFRWRWTEGDVILQAEHAVTDPVLSAIELDDAPLDSGQFAGLVLEQVEQASGRSVLDAQLEVVEH